MCPDVHTEEPLFSEENGKQKSFPIFGAEADVTRTNVGHLGLWALVIVEAFVSLFFCIAAWMNWPGPLFATTFGIVYIVGMCGSGFVCLILAAREAVKSCIAVAAVQPILLIAAIV
jgi:hypothetical protein